MKRILSFLITLLLLIVLYQQLTSSVYAAISCSPTVLVDPANNTLVIFSAASEPEGTAFRINLSKPELAVTSAVQNNSVTFNLGSLPKGTYEFALYRVSKGDSLECRPGTDGRPPSFKTFNVLQIPSPTPVPPPLPLNCVEGLDAQDKPTTDKKLMVKCTKIDTAFGAFDIEPAGFIKSIFTILLGFAGAVAVLLIIISGYRLMTSQGNPEKVQEAREQLTSAVVGLLFIIFSVAILQIIGVDILKLPGFRPQ